MSKSQDGKRADTAVWYKLYPGKLLALSHHQSDDMVFAKRHRAIALALAMQEEGMDSFADELMQSTAEAMKVASDHGKKGADGRWKKPKDGCPSNARASAPEGNGCPSNGIRRDLRDPEDLEDEKNERESKGAAGAAALSQSEIPSLETFKAFGAERGFAAERVQKCWNHYDASGWKDTQGQPVQNWRAKLSSWMNRPEIAAQGEAEKPIAPEDSKRKEAAARRERIIHESADRIIKMQSWIDSGEKCPYWDNPQAEIDKEKEKIRSAYNESGLNDLSKTVVEMQAERAKR